ncbi:uncharacterized protein LOC114074032 [Solanum pennellii]|uniref:Uncharacterized protein LOC114074032 n=1 Tax=Solanum pennellii TaxID=28526 RepID=A0ABM1UW87_SOLPN|nr:uncharacterized protein LOC114074032 [Solanum pennellii]
MKKDIAEYVARCLNRHQVKEDHLNPGGLIQMIEITGRGVYMKISPMKGVMRFGRKMKLSPRYVRSYEILQRVGEVDYEVVLPADLASVHPVFHDSMLKKWLGDPTSILPVEDRQVKRLRNKEVATVKILWRNHLVEDATWEVEADMGSRYPHIFSSGS